MKCYIKTHSWGSCTFYNAYILKHRALPTLDVYRTMSEEMKAATGFSDAAINCGHVSRGYRGERGHPAIHVRLAEPFTRKGWVVLPPGASLPEGVFGI